MSKTTDRGDIDKITESSDETSTDGSNRKRLATYEIFRKSKKILRSPSKRTQSDPEQKERNYGKDTEESFRKKSPGKKDSNMEEKMDRLTDMMSSFVNEIKSSVQEIKNEMGDLKNQIAEVKSGADRTDNELQSLKKESNQNWKELREEVKKLQSRGTELEYKLEKMEEEKVKNNVVMSGILINERDSEKLKIAVKNIMREKLELDIEPKRVYKIGEKRCVIELIKWEDKMEVLRNKNKLIRSEIYIDSDLTPTQRRIMSEMRKRARTERERGNQVKVGHMKLIMKGKIITWDRENGGMVEKILEEPRLETKN